MRQQLSPFKTQLSKQFIRFLCIGSLNTAINYGVFALLYFRLHCYYVLAGGAGVAVACVTGFFMNRAWTFQSEVAIFAGISRYFSVQMVCIVTHCLIQFMATHYLHIIPAISQLLGIGVTLFMNFFLSRRYVFNTGCASV